MSLIKQYTITPEVICDFGDTVSSARINKETRITALKAAGNVIVSGSENVYTDPTLRKIKDAKNGYSDIYGNITKYWKLNYK